MRGGMLLPLLLLLLLPSQGRPDDASLLLAFKDSLINGDELLSSWRIGAGPCTWQGVGCGSDGATIERL